MPYPLLDLLSLFFHTVYVFHLDLSPIVISLSLSLSLSPSYSFSSLSLSSILFRILFCLSLSHILSFSFFYLLYCFSFFFTASYSFFLSFPVSTIFYLCVRLNLSVPAFHPHCFYIPLCKSLSCSFNLVFLLMYANLVLKVTPPWPTKPSKKKFSR